MAIVEKQVMVVGIDDKEHSTFALDWTLKQFFTPFASNRIFRLVIVQAKPSPSVSKPGESEEVLPYSQADLNRIATLVAERADEICGCKLVNDVVVELMQGDARNVLCDAVEKHQASVLVVGSHGFGVIKRAVIGSVSDYCLHNVQCTVMIVKRPKAKTKLRLPASKNVHAHSCCISHHYRSNKRGELVCNVLYPF